MEHSYCLHYAPDNASMIIRLALEEQRVPYRTQLVDRRRHAQRAPAYLALNPHGLIPVLETSGDPVFETGAILLFLSDAHGIIGPEPMNPKRGEMLKWLFYISNTLHPSLRMMFYPHSFVGDAPAAQETLRKVQEANICTALTRIDTYFATASDHAMLLDLYIAPILRWCALYPRERDKGWFDLATYPALKQMVIALEGRASCHTLQAAEGLGPTPFSAPCAPQPPEGSAT